jgi:hypothetical protein
MCDDEFINIDKLVGDIPKDVMDDNEAEMLFAHDILLASEENVIKLYQLQGISDGNAVLRFVGVAKQRPCVIINKFKYKKKECQVVSYMLDEDDITEANEKCKLRMLGIVIKKNKEILGVINFEFFTVAHKKQGKKFSDLIGTPQNGLFMITVNYIEKNETKVEKLKILNKFPGKTKSIYTLIEMLKHKSVIENLLSK